MYRASLIKSVQRGTIAITGATSNTATVTAVDTNNAVLRLIGWSSSVDNDNTQSAVAMLTLTNVTTITASMGSAPSGTLTVSYELIEYYPGAIKSIQRGTIVNAATATITAVNVTKAQVDYLGFTSSAASLFTGISRLTLTNATTVTAVNTTGIPTVTGYQVVEFK